VPTTVPIFAPSHSFFLYKTACVPSSGVPLYTRTAGLPPRLVVHKRPNGGCTVQRSGSIFPRKLRTEMFLPLWAPSEPQVGPRSILLGSQTLLLGSQPYLLGSQTAPVGEPKRTVWVLKSNVWEPKATIWDRSSVGLGPHLGPWDHILAHGAGLGPHVGPWDPHLGPCPIGRGPGCAPTGPSACLTDQSAVPNQQNCGPKPYKNIASAIIWVWDGPS
jgi:hypothetical protein